MLTLFCIPKPYRDPHIALIQENAWRSWREAGPPELELVFLGDEEGVAEAAARAHARHMPEVETDELGTPLVSSAFALAEASAAHPLLAYVDADNILLPDFFAAVEGVFALLERPLLTGQRWDVDITSPLVFGPGWVAELADRARAEGKLHGATGMDYFVFRRGTLGRLPSFTVGRPAWDNWLIRHARQRGLSVVDATLGVVDVHQNHGFGHLPQVEGQTVSGYTDHIQGRRNRDLADEEVSKYYTLYDADLLWTGEGLKPARRGPYLRRRLQRWQMETGRGELPVRVVLGLARKTRALRQRFGLASGDPAGP